MKKKILSMIALMLIAVLMLGACGGNGNDNAGNNDNAGANTDPATTPDGEGAGFEPVDLKMATGGTTGTYYAFGGLVAQMYSEKVDNVKVTIHSSGASKANIFEIADGEADIAMVQNDVAYYAYNGTDLFAEDGAEKDFSVMAAAYAEVCQVIATGDITSIEDLKGKKVSVGDAGSGTEFNARQILEAYGLTFEDITPYNLSFGDSAEALKDAKIDAFFCVAGAPTTAIVDLCTTKDVNLLEVDDAHAAALMDSYPFYTQYTVPGGSYNGIDNDVKTVAVKATFIVSNQISEEAVYIMTKALFENKDSIAHDKAKELDSAYAVAGISVPFHPGAEKYFKEVGALS